MLIEVVLSARLLAVLDDEIRMVSGCSPGSVCEL
jgi:hypothetical protein